MNYRKFGRLDFNVSALGFGAMRLPCSSEHIVDEKEAIRLLRRAVDGGVNYIDTAYIYHDGKSEGILGKALKDGYRQKTKIATKSPVYLLKNPEDFDRILEEQLRRLDTDFIDFYLLHSLNLNTWENTVLKLDVLDRLERAQKSGKIGALGFSFHDSGFDKFQPIVDGFAHWDFCQIQLNYLDTENQAGVKGLRYASQKGLGVVIMEPLLGGRLANPPAPVREVMDTPKSPVELALDFLWDMPEVSLVLSGMSAEKQLEDNLLYAGRATPHMLTPYERETVQRIQQAYGTLKQIPCTKCEYCMPCPAGVEIPKVFGAYNTSVTQDWAATCDAYREIKGKADLCKGCKKCEKICPQKIDISRKMKTLTKMFADVK